jgi:hypothetical protein
MNVVDCSETSVNLRRITLEYTPYDYPSTAHLFVKYKKILSLQITRDLNVLWGVPGTRIVTAIQKPEILYH